MTNLTDAHLAAMKARTDAASEWKVIPLANCEYEASSSGQVRRRINRPPSMAGRILKPSATPLGYKRVDLLGKSYRVHRLVLLAFVGPCPEGHEARHLDNDPGNNKLSNLAWGTKRQNTLDQVAAGTQVSARKTHCPQGHPYDANNSYYEPKTGGRRCVTCDRTRVRARKQKEKTHE